MEENFFKVDPETINQNRFSLSKSESKHLIKSLRSNIGDEIWLLDGLGVASVSYTHLTLPTKA